MSSKLLLDNIKRYNASDFFKLVNVEQLLGNGKKLPPQIHSVPAIMFKETRMLIFGKQVFDYLLLPGKGFLLNLPKKGEKKDTITAQSDIVSDEPHAFSISSGIGTGDSFSFIEDNVTDTQRGYLWCSLEEKINIPTPDDMSGNSEKGEKNQKELPDISALRSQRDLDLQNTLGPQTIHAVPMIPPA